jgi:hypothetical protein
MFRPFLVHARTAFIDAPQDTVRALLNTGRGRQSASRGLCLLANPATLPRISSFNLYPLIRYRVKVIQGHARGCHDVPSVGSLPQRLLYVADTAALGASA